ncbi:MAG: hypothetical protein MPJ24_09610 [Pirellulaceae bacterium]|nr:hypothetical protein [Pirellulaceae bacterium]
MSVADSEPLNSDWKKILETDPQKKEISFNDYLDFGRCDLFNGMCDKNRIVWGKTFGKDLKLALLISGDNSEENQSFFDERLQEKNGCTKTIIAALEYTTSIWYHDGHKESLELNPKKTSIESKDLANLFSGAEPDPPFWPFWAYKAVLNPGNENIRKEIIKLNLLGWHRRIADIDNFTQQAPWLEKMPEEEKRAKGVFYQEVLEQNGGNNENYLRKASEETTDFVIKSGELEVGDERWNIFLRFNIRNDDKNTMDAYFTENIDNFRMKNKTIHSLYKLLHGVADIDEVIDSTAITMVWAIKENGNKDIKFIGSIPGKKVDLIAKGFMEDNGSREPLSIKEPCFDLNATLYEDFDPTEDFKTLVEAYVSAISTKLRSREPEKAVTHFFKWWASTTQDDLHRYGNMSSDDFHNPEVFREVSNMLRMREGDLFKIVTAKELIIESLKGKGNDPKGVNQCPIFVIFLVAWSAYRVKGTDDKKFTAALNSFSQLSNEEKKKVLRTYPLIFNSDSTSTDSTSAMVSAFHLILELATDKEGRATDQVETVKLDEEGLTISFQLGKGHCTNFQSTIDRKLCRIQEILERRQNSNTGDQNKILNTGNQTTQALLHHWIAAQRTSYQKGSGECATFTFEFKKDSITLRWSPKN